MFVRTMRSRRRDVEKLLEKYKDVIPYAVFGVLTTVVNTAVYGLLARVCGLGTMPSTVIAWVAAVLFAYVTNRKWVFHSEAETPGEIAREIASFFACRLATGVVDWLCMYVFVDLLHFDDMVVKVAANVLVIILNYVASRLIIFKKKKGGDEAEAEAEAKAEPEEEA